ncbi:WD40-repeat-containing domain protein [Zychaea mexicana]|uniref:WD40-repeat-containing domain protein n=1 Tax=Zychaea mexicana TaxID=64656 RepID=UPI0022FDB2EE|nr:WD40-repeat-containing domain protein [Zychaea mexicana]KAI9496871.1 WD40-repeat-containing domain protein [Zychaea mexicana]
MDPIATEHKVALAEEEMELDQQIGQEAVTTEETRDRRTINNDNEPVATAGSQNKDDKAQDEIDPQQQAYRLYVYDLKTEQQQQQQCQLLSSTGTRYNTTVRKTLENETTLFQQKVDPSLVYDGNNHFRNAKWSPDGCCLLSNSNDNVLRLFNLPYEMLDEQAETDTITELATNFGIREGETVYDFAWFPSMNSQDPATCCFITSVRDHPMHMWDACTGNLRASYAVIDHRERFVGPNVVSFNLDGSRIYCGYENMIEIFDIQRPGQESQKVPTIPQRRTKKGQKGIISCLDFSPDYAGLYAAGSYSHTVGIYDETNNELCLKLTDIKTGVTQVKFSPDGSQLFSASRVSNVISCWDIRNTAEVLYELPRPGQTSQRIVFDIDPSGKMLITGAQDGSILFHDISNGPETTATTENSDSSRLVRSIDHAHQDLTVCATINPMYPWLIASASGQRKYSAAAGNDDSSDESSDDDDEDDKDDNTQHKDSNSIDNSLKLWRVPGHSEWYSYPVEQEEQQ